MNRFVLTTAAVTALVAGVSVEAAFIVAADATRPLVNGFEQITFRVIAATAPNLIRVNSNDPADDQDAISTLDGTFSVVGGSLALSTPGTAIQFPGRTTNASDFEANGDAPANPPRSFVNYSATAGTISRSPDANLASSIDGVWFTTAFSQWIRPIDTTPLDGFEQTMLARVFVTPGADVSFSGLYQSYNSVDGALSFSSVPEPTTLAVLGLGAGGLLRRRRSA